jgi:hypothetical protein
LDLPTINWFHPYIFQFDEKHYFHWTTDDTISVALNTALSHLDKRSTYVRMLFIGLSSAFNTIVPSRLITNLKTLGLNISLCNWILDFLTV